MIFKIKRKVEKGERHDKMTRKSKSKAKSSYIYCWVVGNNLWCTLFNSTTSLISSWFLVIPLPNHALLSYRMISRVLCSGFIHLARKTFLPSNSTVCNFCLICQVSVLIITFLSSITIFNGHWIWDHPPRISKPNLRGKVCFKNHDSNYLFWVGVL